jgi:hypothetical protein
MRRGQLLAEDIIVVTAVCRVLEVDVPVTSHTLASKFAR